MLKLTAIGDAIDGIADNVKFNGVQLVGKAMAITIGVGDAAASTATVGTATSIVTTNTDSITGANGVQNSADTALGRSLNLLVMLLPVWLQQKVTKLLLV